MSSSVIGSLRVDLGVDTAAFGDGLKAAGSKLAGFGASLRSAIVPVAVAGAAALAGIGTAVKGVIDNADEMSKAAAKFGVPIEELSRLKYAADLSDVSLQTLGTSLGKLSRNMVEAASGSKSQVEAFAAIGVAVTNADGSLRSSSDVLQDISDKFAGMPDGAAKTAAAMELMGKSGAEMIPLLNGGSDALQNMMAEADTFGQVFTAEMGAQAEQFNDNLTRLGGAFGNIAADLTQQLLPYLAQFTDWLVVNGPAIGDTAGRLIDFGAKVVYAGQQVAAFIQVVGDSIVAGVEAVHQFADDVAAALDALPGQMIQIGRDVIDGLLSGLREKWESVKAWFSSLADSIPQWVRDKLGIQSPSTVFAEIGQHIMDGLSVGLSNNMKNVEGEIGNFAQSIASSFASILTGATDWREAMSNILSNVGGNMIEAGIGSLGAAIGIPGFAKGTNFAPGGLALVGERGAEVVDLPRGSRVIPNSDLQGMGGGGASRVELVLSKDLEARILQQAGGQTVRIVSGSMREYDRALPSRMAQVNSDPWRRG